MENEGKKEFLKIIQVEKLSRLDTEGCTGYTMPRSEGFMAVVLNLWLITPWRVEQPFTGVA